MEDESIYGVKVSYLESYLGSDEARKTIKKWRACEKNHNMNFNFWAFLLDEIWYFYKGVYKAGLIFFAICILVPNVVGLIAGNIQMSVTEEYLAEHIIYSNSEDYAATTLREAGSAALLGTVLSFLIIKAVMALFFDYLYFKKVKHCIFYELAGMKDTSDEKNVIACLSIAKRNRDTKEKGLRTGIIIGYIALQVLTIFL